MTEARTYPIPAQLLQDLVNYLQTKPWQESNGFLVAFQQIARSVDFPPGALPATVDVVDRPKKVKKAEAVE